MLDAPLDLVMDHERTARASELMRRFAARTGLTDNRPPRRYLWTDAFAVSNFLGLARLEGDPQYEALALRLIDQVHHVLGRHRPDDARRGWISGLSDADGEAHPTRGGLRIGKRLPERTHTEAFESELEWDRDGQYFHYLTKWMHALDRAACVTGEPKLNLWARELAQTALRAFTYGGARNRRMAWKMSIDLSRPLVSSMGQHDPLDGFVTCKQLEATTAAMHWAPVPSLVAEAAEFGAMIDLAHLTTDDPLGIGGLLVDASRLAQLGGDEPLVPLLLAASLSGLRRYSKSPTRLASARFRLAFRELGLAIGLAGVALIDIESLRAKLEPEALRVLRGITEYLPLRDEIETFWLSRDHRRTPTWLEHEDINDVMLATSLAPKGFLVLSNGMRGGAP